MSTIEPNSPSPRASEVFDWFRHGAGIGLFIGIAVALVTQADYWGCVLGGVVSGVIVWPLLAGLLAALADQRGTVAETANLFGRGLATLILVLFVVSVLVVLGFKVYVDFLMPEPAPFSGYVPHAVIR